MTGRDRTFDCRRWGTAAVRVLPPIMTVTSSPLLTETHPSPQTTAPNHHRHRHVHSPSGTGRVTLTTTRQLTHLQPVLFRAHTLPEYLPPRLRSERREGNSSGHFHRRRRRSLYYRRSLSGRERRQQSQKKGQYRKMKVVKVRDSWIKALVIQRT